MKNAQEKKAIVINAQDIVTALQGKYNPTKWGGLNYYYLAGSLRKSEALSWAKTARCHGCFARVVTRVNKPFGKEFVVFIRSKKS